MPSTHYFIMVSSSNCKNTTLLIKSGKWFSSIQF
jgi:hypothetical protein